MDREQLTELEKQIRAEVLRPHLMTHLVRNALYRCFLHREINRTQAEVEIRNAETMLDKMDYDEMVRMHRVLLGLDDDKETAV